MQKKIRIILLFFLFIKPAYGQENSITISKIENYLNSIQTIQSEFIQINNTGAVETGKFLLKKPGKMRFEYNLPSQHLVISSGFLLVIIDKKSSGEPQRYLASKIPLFQLTKNKLSFEQSNSVKALFSENNNTHLILFNSKKPKDGELELVFSNTPIRLKEWVLTNYMGERTRVLMENLQTNILIEEYNFDIGNEITKARNLNRE